MKIVIGIVFGILISATVYFVADMEFRSSVSRALVQ
jgi:hypothetical protein